MLQVRDPLELQELSLSALKSAARKLAAAGDLERAAETWEAVCIRRASPYSIIQCARALALLGRFAEARARLAGIELTEGTRPTVLYGLFKSVFFSELLDVWIRATTLLLEHTSGARFDKANKFFSKLASRLSRIPPDRLVDHSGRRLLSLCWDHITPDEALEGLRSKHLWSFFPALVITYPNSGVVKAWLSTRSPADTWLTRSHRHALRLFRRRRITVDDLVRYVAAFEADDRLVTSAAILLSDTGESPASLLVASLGVPGLESRLRERFSTRRIEDAFHNEVRKSRSQGAVSGEAIVVSFYAGAQYYHDCARRLVDDLDRLGLEHDVVHIAGDREADWIDLCARKILFYREMLVKHQRPILWVDVDAKLLKHPAEILHSTADLTCFLRNFKPFTSFDPAQFARLLHPGYLRFAYNARVISFLNHAASLVSQGEGKATDDYYLQMALMKWGANLTYMIMGPDDICFSPEAKNYSRASFMHKSSGNVDIYVGAAKQDVPNALTIERQKRVLMEGANAVLKRGKRQDALVFLRRSHEIDRDDAVVFGKYLTVLRRNKDYDLVAKTAKSAQKNAKLRLVAQRALFECLIDQKEHEKAREFAQGLASSDAALAGFMRSRLFREGLNEEAERRGIDESERVKLWWMETPYPGNFGDIINPYIVEKLTGVPPKFSTADDRVLMIGSIIKFAKARTSVWGTGCPDALTAPHPEAIYHAVRGPLTQELVGRAGGKCSGVFGDPAWIMPRLYAPTVKKTHELGLILHHVHNDVPLRITDGVKVIDIRRCGYGEIEQFVDEMLSCEAVLSTSMHGIILAHAYGVPVRYCAISHSHRQLSGDGMKFEDYYRSVGRAAPAPLNLTDLRVIDPSLRLICKDDAAEPIDVPRLLCSAPFQIRAPA